MNRRTMIKQAGLATSGLLLSPSDATSRIISSGTQSEAMPRNMAPHLQPKIAIANQTIDIQTASPVDHGGALVNPGMGWTMHFYSWRIADYGSRLEPSDTLDDFPGLSVAYLRVPWSFVEPQKNKFAWETLDTPAQRWIDKGKKIALRINATESWMFYATPKWVYDDGVPGFECDHETRIMEPDYGDPVFLEHVEHFVDALADRYDGNPNVAFIDVGHYGMWGEGHTVITTPKHGKSWDMEVQKKIIDIYCRHFKKTLICISDDYAGHDLRGDRFPIMDYAFSHGVTMRDDSILVSKSPNHWYHAEMAQLFWPSLPVILEHEHYGHSVDRGAWNGELLVQSVEDYHASYMSIHWWPREFLEKNREFIDRINQRMGYRLQLNAVKWPRNVRLGEAFVIESEWRNAGVAPCYGGGFPCFTLKDEKDGIVSVWVDDRLNVKTLPTDKPGRASSTKLTSQITVAPAFADRSGDYFRACQAGTYQLYVSLGAKDGTPLYELPYAGSDGRKRYRMGQIVVAAR